MDFKRIIFAAFLFMLSNLTFAAQVDNLYQVKTLVPVEQTGKPSPDQLSRALQLVLVKVTGRTDLKSNAVIKAQISVAEDYLQKFSYESVPVSTEQTATTQSLILNFNQIAVDGLVNHAGFKKLGSQRPTVLVWAANNLGGTQAFLTAESPETKELQRVADLRGLPLQFPIYDLQDQTSLPVSDLWGLFTESIKQASSRYVPDAVVAARIQSSVNGFTQVEWILIDGNDPQRRSTAGPLEQVMPELVNTTADELFAPIVKPVSYELSYFQTGLAINISNINTFSDYIHVTDYLRSLPVITSLKPETIQGTQASVRVELDGNTTLLKEALSLEPRLQAMDFTRNPDGTEVLHYYWQE